MSRAFLKDDIQAAAEFVPPRPALPSDAPNLVTPRGLRLLEAERAALEAERDRRVAAGDPSEALEQRLADLQHRLATAQPVQFDPAAGQVTFGALVEVERLGAGERVRATTQRITIVGVDEADPAHGRVAFVSPLARALMGARVGDEVTLGERGTRLRVQAISAPVEAEDADDERAPAL